MLYRALPLGGGGGGGGGVVTWGNFGTDVRASILKPDSNPNHILGLRKK